MKPRHVLAAVGLVIGIVTGACGTLFSSHDDTPIFVPPSTSEPVSPTSSIAADDPVVDPAEWSLAWPIHPSRLDPANPPQWSVSIERTLPHDQGAFTQGYELIDGFLFESTGLLEQSTLRIVDPTTGAVVRTVPLPDEIFAEGITRAGDTIIQLTWENEIAFRWSLPDLEPLEPFTYDHDGWGICELEPGIAVVSDGTAQLRLRSTTDFALIETIDVTYLDRELSALNELECVDGFVLANLRRSEFIAVIDPSSGAALATIDATILADREGFTDDNRAVLNGIAHLNDRELALTGKLWSSVYVVTLDG